MRDKLDEMFELQKLFQDRFIKEMVFDSEKDRQEFINLNLLACFSELCEIMGETLWKKKSVIKFGWKENMQFDKQKFKEEIIDLWHFVMNLWLSVSIDTQEFYHIYRKKMEINMQRQQDGY